MTTKEALHVLIQHTMNDILGVGTGVRTLPSDKEKERARQAIQKIYKMAWGYELSDEEARRLF